MNSGSQSENENILIDNVKRGDRASFDKLVSSYRQFGLGIAYNLVGNLEDAKDVLQEAFIKVYLKAFTFQGDAQFSTWFYRVVVNCALNFLKRRKRSRDIFADSIPQEDRPGMQEKAADDRYSPRARAIARELGRKTDECIANLSEKQKLCFVLRHQSGMSIEEISRIMKCNPSTVKVHIFRAVDNLRRCMSKYTGEV